MRYVLYWMAMALVSAAQAQVSTHHFIQKTENTFTISEKGLPHVLEYPLPRQTVLLEFNQDECQALVTEEYIIPDVPANPGNAALTMLFNAECDVGLSNTDTAPMAAMGLSTAAPTPHSAPKEIIEEFLVDPDSLRMLIKFDK
jgi:hypothetical protein